MTLLTYSQQEYRCEIVIKISHHPLGRWCHHLATSSQPETFGTWFEFAKAKKSCAQAPAHVIPTLINVVLRITLPFLVPENFGYVLMNHFFSGREGIWHLDQTCLLYLSRWVVNHCLSGFLAMGG